MCDIRHTHKVNSHLLVCGLGKISSITVYRRVRVHLNSLLEEEEKFARRMENKLPDSVCRLKAK